MERLLNNLLGESGCDDEAREENKALKEQIATLQEVARESANLLKVKEAEHAEFKSKVEVWKDKVKKSSLFDKAHIKTLEEDLAAERIRNNRLKKIIEEDNASSKILDLEEQVQVLEAHCKVKQDSVTTLLQEVAAKDQKTELWKAEVKARTLGDEARICQLQKQLHEIATLSGDAKMVSLLEELSHLKNARQTDAERIQSLEAEAEQAKLEINYLGQELQQYHNANASVHEVHSGTPPVDDDALLLQQEAERRVWKEIER